MDGEVGRHRYRKEERQSKTDGVRERKKGKGRGGREKRRNWHIRRTR